MVKAHRMLRRSFPLILAVSAALVSGCSAIAIDPSAESLQDGSAEEQELLACLEEAGWDVQIGRGGGVTAEYREEQYDQYRAAVEACDAGRPPAEEVVLTDEILTDGYALQTKTLECLRGEGYEGLSDPPTLQAYIDSRGSWVPYGDLPAMPEDEWIEIQETCPQPNISPDGY